MVGPPTCERPPLTGPLPDPYRRFSVRLHHHTGALVLWHQRSYTCTGTLEQCEEAYRHAQMHCLLAGWWGLLSLLLMNPIALISNYTGIRRVRGLATQAPPPAAPPHPVGPPPGWYPDPGGPGQRYWNGAAWTHWTHPR
ncbi:DUF2510 domain-containing protein [Mycobacterium sherrisii]|uniref:DUF2510 domain-containing protein n=1 Tax=Mycobacterium sherrisii TaxID=243061 RepID=A0A1E3T4V6_9MYCO|nr:DUF2510 domain-containing protein [Mycobacterium sherrisii]MCV7030117.1 DUF2510 domain-containing protein [Mycobacterium sherrisii]MEC4762459.1 DUF2510 domain-containing protein [Mycobacterium sherrisii]ODR09427.1 hypothetical protein BHQ21_04555 [Mycobacterium sherrisii]ORW86543.1 hypothetical protein AWC25_20420 [Mycobacterium sherrisii]